MNSIVLDLEWNRVPDGVPAVTEPLLFDSEIIEIGAIKLDDDYRPVDEYKAFIRPVFYPVLAGDISRLTHITAAMLKNAPTFPEVYAEFIAWCGAEYAFMTWGPTDVPVLMDNLLMHGMTTESIPVCYDLQRVFGREVLRSDTQCSLENAMKMLNYPMERAHDALNDVRNTVKIANFMELDGCLDLYFMAYVGYGADRVGSLFGKKAFPSLSEALEDDEVRGFACPFCGKTLLAEDFREGGMGRRIGIARCDEGDDFYLRYSARRHPEGGVSVTRAIFEMNDDLWERYDEAEPV